MPNQILRKHPSSTQLPQRRYRHLTPDQVATWMHYGYIHVRAAFSRAAAADQTRDLWTRLTYDPADMSTWRDAVTYLPARDRNTVRPSEFAPKAWAAICELCGGEDRVDTDACDWWDDGFIVNLGSADDEGKETNVVENVNGWHVDGDFFVHFLDSPEQALLLVPLWSDIIEGAGGTVVCCDGIGRVARQLYAHPEGLNESLQPLNPKPGVEQPWICGEIVDQSKTFFELTGEAGDVYILHPFMIHSAAKNGLRIPRLITNPGISLKRPFNFDRNEPSQYSLLELKTLKELGVERLKGWKIKGKRKKDVVSDWRKEEDARNAAKEKEREEKRLESERLAQRYHEAMMLDRRPPPMPPKFTPPRPGSIGGNIRLE